MLKRRLGRFFFSQDDILDCPDHGAYSLLGEWARNFAVAAQKELCLSAVNAEIPPIARHLASRSYLNDG